jgi:hypothetical protein
VSVQLGQLIAAEPPYQALQYRPKVRVQVPHAVTDGDGRGLAFGIADAVQVVHGDARFSDGIIDNIDGPLSMMCGRITGKEPFSGWCNVGMSNV